MDKPLEQLINRALMEILPFSGRAGLIWTPNVLAERMGLWGKKTGVPDMETAERIVSELLLRELIWREKLPSHGAVSYRITQKGKTHIENADRHPQQYGPEAQRFKNEVLEGMTESGAETSIKDAALPTKEQKPPPKQPPVFVPDQMSTDEALDLARSLKITMDQLVDGIATGRIHKCKGGQGIGPHFGVFHKKNDRFQALCTECTKRLRKNRPTKNS